MGFIRLVAVPGWGCLEPGTNMPVVLGVFLLLAPIFNMQSARAEPLDLIGESNADEIHNLWLDLDDILSL